MMANYDPLFDPFFITDSSGQLTHAVCSYVTSSMVHTPWNQIEHGIVPKVPELVYVRCDHCGMYWNRGTNKCEMCAASIDVTKVYPGGEGE